MELRKPTGLQATGTRLWERMLETYEMDGFPVDQERLVHACRVADKIAKLEREAARQPSTVLGSARQKTINPLVAEARFQRGLLDSLLKKLDLPDDRRKRTAVPSTSAQVISLTDILKARLAATGNQ